jgi:hypothetical protein
MGQVWVHLTQVQIRGVVMIGVQRAGQRIGAGITTGLIKSTHSETEKKDQKVHLYEQAHDCKDETAAGEIP